ncbi:hypothetical protein BDZ91DRAFT_785775 [Kalaharituber pfeilii]|nr:hypothetical protein BDZ91DRAFT_785775 [Kalaharituber pfeilii]
MVETRSQTRAREEAAKGPAGRAGARSRETSSRAAAASASASAPVPPSPAAKKANAARKNSKLKAAAAVAGSTAKRKTGAKAGGSGRAKSTRQKRGPLDTLAKDLGRGLPEEEEEEEEDGDEIVEVEELESITVRLPGEIAAGGSGEKGTPARGKEFAVEVPSKPSEAAGTTSEPDQLPPSARKTQPEPIATPSPVLSTPSSKPAAPATHITLDDDGSPTASESELETAPSQADPPSPSPSTQPSDSLWIEPYPDLSPAERAETISGYVCYRTDYASPPQEWERYKQTVMDKFKEQEARHGKEEAALEIVWVEDWDRFGKVDVNNLHIIREAFNGWCLERNPHAPNPATYPFPSGPYQDFSPNLCLVADTLSITSVLSSSPTATILVLDRHYDPATHAEEVAEALAAGDDVDGAPVPTISPTGFRSDPREADAARLERGDKVVWKGYKGYFRAGIDEWMNIESEAQAEWDLPGFWMQYFAKYADGRTGGWELTTCGVLE